MMIYYNKLYDNKLRDNILTPGIVESKEKFRVRVRIGCGWTSRSSSMVQKSFSPIALQIPVRRSCVRLLYGCIFPRCLNFIFSMNPVCRSFNSIARQSVANAFWIGFLGLCAGCATSPVSGRSEYGLMDRPPPVEKKVAVWSDERAKSYLEWSKVLDSSAEAAKVTARIREEKSREFDELETRLSRDYGMDPTRTYTFDPNSKTIYLEVPATEDSPARRLPHRVFPDDADMNEFVRLLLEKQKILSQRDVLVQLEAENIRKQEWASVTLMREYLIKTNGQYRYDVPSHTLYEITPSPTYREIAERALERKQKAEQAESSKRLARERETVLRDGLKGAQADMDSARKSVRKAEAIVAEAKDRLQKAQREEEACNRVRSQNESNERRRSAARASLASALARESAAEAALSDARKVYGRRESEPYRQRLRVCSDDVARARRLLKEIPREEPLPKMSLSVEEATKRLKTAEGVLFLAQNRLRESVKQVEGIQASLVAGAAPKIPSATSGKSDLSKPVPVKKPQTKPASGAVRKPAPKQDLNKVKKTSVSSNK